MTQDILAKYHLLFFVNWFSIDMTCLFKRCIKTFPIHSWISIHKLISYVVVCIHYIQNPGKHSPWYGDGDLLRKFRNCFAAVTTVSLEAPACQKSTF